MEGNILLHRKILDSSVFASEKRLKIWIWLLCKASYKTRSIAIKIGKGEKIVTIERGQLLFGRYKAEEALNIDGSTIYKILQLFEKEDMISIQSNSHYTILEVNNYNDYQTLETNESNSHQTAIEQPFDSNSTTIQQPLNTYISLNTLNKVNKVINKNNNKYDFKNSLISLGIDEKIVNDWLIVRKEKKASNTETAFNKIKSEIEKSKIPATECIKIAVEKNWRGFEASWLSQATIVKPTDKYKINPDIQKDPNRLKFD
jgi:hypothetical protein